MGIACFFKNLKYMFKISLKDINKRIIDLENPINNKYILEQIFYEFPNSEIARPRILNHEQTINEILEKRKSIARFGDGEISIINGNSIPFQEYNKVLATRLKNILENKNNNILVGINYEYYYPKINLLNKDVADFYRYYVPKYREKLSSLIDWNTKYCAAGFTQLYMSYKNYDLESHYNILRKIWNKQLILLVGCKEAFSDIKFNIFDNSEKIDYLYIPNKNAYSNYDDIYSSITKYTKNTIIILMAGPCAKLLVEDLSNQNYFTLDLGHLMKDYDWYKKNIVRDSKNINKFMLPDE